MREIKTKQNEIEIKKPKKLYSNIQTRKEKEGNGDADNEKEDIIVLDCSPLKEKSFVFFSA